MSWWRVMPYPWRLLQEKVRGLGTISREDPEELLPGSDLSDADQRAALERETQRRSEREAR